MDHSAYVQVLLSVLVGLGLGDLVKDFHRLVRHQGVVSWFWLPICWAGFTLLMVVQTWWAYFTLIQSPLWSNLFAFLLPLVLFITLYLICASALPEVSRNGESLDMESFYFGQRGYFFGLWGALLVMALIVNIMVRGQVDILGADGFRVLGIAAAAFLATSSSKLLHVVVTWLAIIGLALYIALFSLRLA